MPRPVLRAGVLSTSNEVFIYGVSGHSMNARLLLRLFILITGAARTKRKDIMQRRLHSIQLLLVVLALLMTTPAWALPLTGFLEASADTGWQGAFAVRLTDGTVVNGLDQVTLGSDFSSLPLVTSGCIVSPSCVAVTNFTTSTDFTMSVAVLFPDGTATLGSLGTLSWGTQPVWLLPGDPSPTVAVLAIANGTLGGTILTSSSFSFGFNSTLTASFISVAGGQALSSVRLDFTDGTPPPRSQTLGLLGQCCLIDNGVPVALGTPLAVPEPPAVLLLSLGMAGLLGWQWKRQGIALS